MCPFQLQPLNMFVERTLPGKLNVNQSYKCGQLLLEIAKMRGLNEFNLKRMWPEEKEGNMPLISSNFSLDDRTTIGFMIKRTKRFNYSIRVNDDERAEQNYFEDKEMNGIQDEEINISPSLHRLLYARLTQKKTQNWKNTTTMKIKSDFVFLKPKVYQCHYCHKLFFHSATYRRHMIHQLKKLHWCSICKRGFISQTWFRKHKLFCYIS